MNKYSELKNHITNKFFSPIYETDNEAINALDIMESIRIDILQLQRIELLVRDIEQEENKQPLIERIKSKIMDSYLPANIISINFESLNGTSKIIINFPENKNVCICRDCNSYDLFLQTKRSNKKEIIQKVKRLVNKYNKQFLEILDTLDYYSLKYSTDIKNNHFVSPEGRNFNIQTIYDEPFILDIFIGKNFKVDYKVRFEDNIDPDNLLEEDSMRNIPLLYYINKNKDDFLQHFFVFKEDLDPKVKMNIAQQKKKIR